MRYKLTVFLLLLNLVTTLTVGYTIYSTTPILDQDALRLNSKQLEEIKKHYVNLRTEVELADIPNPEDKSFRENMYKGMSMIMSGQGQLSSNQQRLNIDLLRLHHFIEPHADKFYAECPECQKEKKQIVNETKKEEGSSTKFLPIGRN